MTSLTEPDCAVMGSLISTTHGSAEEGRHGICGMPEGLARLQD